MPAFDLDRYAALRGSGRIGARVHARERTGSTMDDARAGAGARGAQSCGDAYVAAEQTAGRGRFRRPWVAAPGTALLVTFHLCLPDTPNASLIGVAGALAAADAIAETSGLATEQKWPNDVLAGGRKLVGILAEARSAEAGRRDVFLGIGINVRAGAIAGLPDEDRARATTIEGAAGDPPAFETLLAALARHLERRVDACEETPEALLDEWRGRLVTIGQWIRLATSDAEIEGEAIAVSPLGELVLRQDDGTTASYAAGDVTTL